MAFIDPHPLCTSCLWASMPYISHTRVVTIVLFESDMFVYEGRKFWLHDRCCIMLSLFLKQYLKVTIFAGTVLMFDNFVH